MSAAIICKNPAEFSPTATFTPIPVGGTVANSSVVIDSMAFKKVDTSGASLNYSVSQTVPQFKAGWVLSSDTPSICTVSGNLITRVASGTGIVRLSGPEGFSITSRLDFTSSASTSYVWTGFSGISKSSQLSNPILSLLNPSKDKNYYITSYPFPPYTPPTAPFPRNPNCWAAALDLTGSPIATTLYGPNMPYNSGALITPRHWIGVRHFGNEPQNMGPGATLWFADAAGNIYPRTVLQRYISIKDQIICLLDSDLPVSVKPFKFAGVSMFDFPNKRAYGMGWKIHQNKFISAAVFDNVQTPQIPSQTLTDFSIEWYNFSDGSAAQLTDTAHILYPVRNFLKEGISGDSGGAIGGYYNGETYLVSLFTSGDAGGLFSGKMAAEINAVIASLDAAQGIATGYTVGVLEVS
jgi:hypothetical protein